MALGSRLLVLAFFLSAAAGTVLGLIALLAGKLKKNEPMPFAPAILAGTLTSCFYGEPMIEWSPSNGMVVKNLTETFLGKTTKVLFFF